MKQYFSFLFGLFLLAGIPGQAQTIHFDHLSINDGLSQSTVNVILQDEKGFIWFGTKDGLNRYDGKSFKIFKHSPFSDSGLKNNSIRCMVEGADNRLWVGTDSGLCVYTPEKESFTDIPLYDIDGRVITKPISMLECGPDGCIWIVVEANGVFCYDPEKDSLTCCYQGVSSLCSLKSDDSGKIWFFELGHGLFYTDDRFQHITPFLDSRNEKIFPSDNVTFIAFNDSNKMYLGFEEHGVVEVNLLNGLTARLPLTENPDTPVFVRHILQYDANELWVGTESGIFIYNLRTRQAQQLRNSLYDPYSLSDNAVYCFCKDREGGLWIGTFFGGINYLPQRGPDFRKFYPTDAPRSLKGRRVREICPDNDGSLWIGTEDAGLYHFDPENQEFRFIEQSRDFSNVHGLLMDGEDLWISTFSKGIRVLDTRTGAIRKYDNASTRGRLFSNYVFALCKSLDGRIYIGTMHGLQYFDPETQLIYYVPEINDGKMVNDIREDSDGNLWVATFSNGVYRYNINNEEWEHLLHDVDDDNSLPCDNVTSIFEDSNKQIWLTTEGAGFCRFDPSTGKFVCYTSADGMPSDVVFQIVEDNQGLFWITTNQGLVSFDPQSEQIVQVYTVANRLLCNQFNYKSGYRSREGIIYFGCIEGLISFDPKSLSKGYDGYLPPIYITDFSLLDSKTPIGEKNSPLLKSCIYCDSIRLRYNQNSFSLQLAVLGYRNPAAYRPIYKLEGFDDQWRQIPQNGSTVSYSKLRPGKYLFRAQVTNGEEIGERTLYVRITPPFYRSKGAYFIYILLMASVIYLAITYQDRRHKRREWQRIRAFEQEKEREMYNGKIKFFTDITHEIRTPLTLIKVPLENILKKKEVNKELIDDLNIMNRNTNRLLDLTNQLLDFQKIEKERMTLNLVRQNVAAIVEETCYRFSSTVKQQGKSFGLAIDADKDTMWADIDKEAFTKVISNLLLNALKYSESRIRVHMSGANGSLRLTVVNDGEVVPKEVREKIFTPFFQHAHKSEFTGSGIGLSLSRSLIELQHGTLVMGPSETENEFILTIPLSVEEGESQLAEYDDMIPEAPDTAQSLAGETYTILVVEDHAEMRTYIHRMLSEHYTVITANDGLEALEQLDSKHINLIITDIMMPRMDGIELCERVKNDLKFSHIPLILLTAKTNLQSKIQGMETGADVYIEKPFSADYLLSVIANLIKGRQTLYESFTKNPLVMASRMATSQVDMDFIRRLQEIIHANFNNPEFKPNEIAKMMHMSRASFYRKVKGVLDVTPNDYIQIERLKTAAQLLKEGKYHINEVCYMVGFSSPSYFAKCFQRQFGMLPKQFAADKGEQEQPTDDKNP